VILDHLGVDAYVAVDPAPGLIERARARFAEDARVRVAVASATDTGEPGEAFDVVLGHTVYSHLAEPDAAIAEAARVLRPGGRLVIFDGDYASLTVARDDADPLQAALELVKRQMIHAPYVLRSLPRRLAAAGFVVEGCEPYAYLGTERPDYFLTLFRRGLAAARTAGDVGPELAEAVLAEARHRIEAGTFFAAVLFMSIVARKPSV
jgi:SAM-dependent methyltransferase